MLAERVDVVAVPAGQAVYSTGDPGDAMYVFARAGRIFFKNDTGEKSSSRPRAGRLLRRDSFLDGGPRTAGAIAPEDFEALVVDHGDLDECPHQPAAAMDLLSATGGGSARSRAAPATASRNVNEATEDNAQRGHEGRRLDREFTGSLPFLFIHCASSSCGLCSTSGRSCPPLGGSTPSPSASSRWSSRSRRSFSRSSCCSARTGRPRETRCATTSNTTSTSRPSWRSRTCTRRSTSSTPRVLARLANLEKIRTPPSTRSLSSRAFFAYRDDGARLRRGDEATPSTCFRRDRGPRFPRPGAAVAHRSAAARSPLCPRARARTPRARIRARAAPPGAGGSRS